MVRRAWVVLLWLPWLSHPSSGAVISVCAMTLDHVTRIYNCARPVVPQIVIDVFDAQIKVFPGKTQGEVTRMICSAVDDDSDLLPDVKAIVSAVLEECARSA
ncbi:uncharacterized protein LOC142566739 isoform X2 [Dermacentor variabilis]|uniref:uncharacterized protein LOC142566739 isoform X2 n=1 Tax=Dermacentor variabilis TaxID=34621 RepID=UPI003F5ADE79